MSPRNGKVFFTSASRSFYWIKFNCNSFWRD